IYNQTNWDIHFSEKNGASVYAKWINSDEALFIFDVTNGGDFTLDFKNDNGFVGKIYQKTINISQLESDLSYFPCASDLVAPKNKVFAGWYLDANFNNPFNANTILNSLNTRTNGNYTLYPKFEDLPTIRLIYHWDGFAMIDGIAEEYYDNSGFYNVSLIVLDNGNTYSLAENSLPKEEYFNLFNYVFDGWYLDSEFTIEFNENNYNLQVSNAREDAIYQSIEVNVFLKSHWQE
ncbi:MAG: InlB B-repeat-containing protein, partial [Clostridia bacterium]|nr:InlB B-repeat-containing protein [Clostridia bacterium]